MSVSYVVFRMTDVTLLHGFEIIYVTEANCQLLSPM